MSNKIVVPEPDALQELIDKPELYGLSVPVYLVTSMMESA